MMEAFSRTQTISHPNGLFRRVEATAATWRTQNGCRLLGWSLLTFKNKGHCLKEGQYGSFMIFLSLIFYVKSILGILKVQKLPSLPFWGSEFCLFSKCQALKSVKVHENENSEPRKVLKWLILHFKNPQN